MKCRCMGSGRNTGRFGNTTVSGTVGVGNLSLSVLLARLKPLVATEHCSVQYRGFAVETIFKNDPVIVTEWIFRRHFNIHRNDSVTSHDTVLLWVRNFRETASAAKKKTSRKNPFT